MNSPVSAPLHIPGPNHGPGGELRPSFFHASANRQLTEACASSIAVSSPKPSPDSLYRRSIGTPKKVTKSFRKRGDNTPKVTNPLLLPYVKSLWNKGKAEEPDEDLQPEPPKKPKGVPALLPSWVQDRMDNMHRVSDRFSCAIAMALASELEQRMVDEIMEVDDGGRMDHMGGH